MTNEDRILFIVSHPDASAYLVGMGAAAARRGVKFSIFFTGNGVKLLSDNYYQLKSVTDAADEAIACEYAWNSRQQNSECPVKMGSQTDHSRMIGVFNKVVSL